MCTRLLEIWAPMLSVRFGAFNHRRPAATEKACLPTLAGISVVLISRTQSRLDEAAKEIEAKYKVKTKTLAVDFGKADAGTWSTLKAEVRCATIGLEETSPSSAVQIFWSVYKPSQCYNLEQMMGR